MDAALLTDADMAEAVVCGLRGEARTFSFDKATYILPGDEINVRIVLGSEVLKFKMAGLTPGFVYGAVLSDDRSRVTLITDSEHP
jgi:hypothetical protein